MSLNTEAYKAAWRLFPSYINDKASYESLKETRGFIYEFLRGARARMSEEERQDIRSFLDTERWL